MALTEMFKRHVERVIARLHDPSPLDASEKALLQSLLNNEEQVERLRLQREILAGRNLMALPVGEHGHSGHEYERIIENHPLQSAINLVHNNTGYARRGIARAEAAIAAFHANGQKNPNILSSHQAELAKWQKLLADFVGDVEKIWNDMDLEVRRRGWFHKGQFSFENMPDRQSREHIFYPDEPDHIRLSYIEVLQAKLAKC